MRYLPLPITVVLSVVALFPGCNEPTKPTSPNALVAIYRDSRMISGRYTGVTVRLAMLKKDYEVDREKGEVVWYATDPPVGPPAVVCKFKDKCRVPLDSKDDILIRGVCKGAKRDGLLRAPRVDFGVSIEECE